METLIRVDQGLASERRVLEQGKHSETGVMTLLSIMIQGMKLGGRRTTGENESTAEHQGTTLVVLYPRSSRFRDQTIRLSDTITTTRGREPADTQKQQTTTNKHTHEHHLGRADVIEWRRG
jgi:hypothetical protein